MLRWLAEQLLKVFNFVPEMFLDESDPHFDVLRWWLLFVVVAVIVTLGVFVKRAFWSKGQ
jgi:hypothetical protein